MTDTNDADVRAFMRGVNRLEMDEAAAGEDIPDTGDARLAAATLAKAGIRRPQSSTTRQPLFWWIGAGALPTTAALLFVVWSSILTALPSYKAEGVTYAALGTLGSGPGPQPGQPSKITLPLRPFENTTRTPKVTCYMRRGDALTKLDCEHAAEGPNGVRKVSIQSVPADAAASDRSNPDLLLVVRSAWTFEPPREALQEALRTHNGQQPWACGRGCQAIPVRLAGEPRGKE